MTPRTAFLAAALAAASFAPANALAWPDSAVSRDIAFAVTRAGEPMGRHSLSFRQDGENLHVDIAIELEVRLAFITVFRYSHRNSETWRDGRLVRLETTTNDDGTRHQVRAEATAEGLRVTDSAGRSYLAPADTIPTSYWNKETVRRGELLNTQTGKMMPIRIERRSESTAALGAADHYRLVMMDDRDGTPIDVWYDKQSLAWVKLAFEARGSNVDYALAAIGEPVQQAAK
ncbi:MAG: DUF6134 family protein [Alphaproteobacteria bacterium]